MPTPHTPKKGAPCWFDLASSDTAKSRAFYGALFGWTSEEAGEEYGGYVNFSFEGAPMAGCMANDGSRPDGWSVYLATDDITKVVETTPGAGGSVVLEPMPVGSLGQMAFVSDAGGAMVGAWQAGEHVGFEAKGDPGTPSWFELHTRDLDASMAFYREVYGLDVEMAVDEPGFRYAIASVGDEQVAGMMDAGAFLPEGVPAHWSVYIHVADVAATVAKAQELGGSLVQGPDDTPYGVLAVITDPTGAVIKLQTPNR